MPGATNLHPEPLARERLRWRHHSSAQPVLSPPSPCLAAETEAAETKSAPDVSRGPLAVT